MTNTSPWAVKKYDKEPKVKNFETFKDANKYIQSHTKKEAGKTWIAYPEGGKWFVRNTVSSVQETNQEEPSNTDDLV